MTQLLHTKKTYFCLFLLTISLLPLVLYQLEPAEAEVKNRGAHLGNLTYEAEREFESIGKIQSIHGHASVAMVGGYLMAVYSSDSGGNLDDGGIDMYDLTDPDLSLIHI